MQDITRIPLEGVHNTRDLGGFMTSDGSYIKPHRLIRSGELYNLTNKDKEILTGEYELTKIIDFRTKTEREERPDPNMEGVAYVINPILKEKALGITREKDTDNDVVSTVLSQLEENEGAGIAYMENLYSNFISSEFSKQQYTKFFEVLLNQEQGAVLWHCSAGKDRVGTGTALLLSSFGVPRELIMADYMKVNEFGVDNINQMVQSVVEKSGDRKLGEHIRTLFTVHKSYLETLFAKIEKEYGTVKRFLKEEMSLDKEATEILKNKYLLSSNY